MHPTHTAKGTWLPLQLQYCILDIHWQVPDYKDTATVMNSKNALIGTWLPVHCFSNVPIPHQQVPDY